MKLKPLDEQVMVVMGASSGIGRVTAKEAARRGASVVVSARDAVALDSLVAEIGNAGGRALAWPADVSDPEAVEEVALAASATFGGIDTWVHTAAVALYARFEDTTPREFARVVEVNLLGQVHGAMAALPRLRAAGQGAFIAISSVEARRAFPYHSAYAAAKHGVEAFLEALRVELREEGVPIAITNVMPASINTPLFDKARTKLGVKPKPPPPIYEPETVARVILHAAEHPARDLIAGGAGLAIVDTERLSPALFDALMVRLGFRTQRTDEPKTAFDPDNLDAPIMGFGAERGSFRAHRHSVFNWLETHTPLSPVRRLATRPPRWRDTPEPAYFEKRSTASSASERAMLVRSLTG